MCYVKEGKGTVFAHLTFKDLIRRTSGALCSVIGVNGVTLAIAMIRSLCFLSLSRLINGTRVNRVEAAYQAVSNGRARTYEKCVMGLAVNVYR